MRTLNMWLIVVGIALLGHGYVGWTVRLGTSEAKTAVDILSIVPGWALLTMGYVGRQCQGCGIQKAKGS